jgi:hypothetical protein
MSEHTSQTDAPVHSDIRFEADGVRFGPILWVAIVGTIVTAGFCAAMYGLYGVFAAREAAESGPRNPLASQYARTEPPAPRLQARPVEDLRELHAREMRALEGYAWIDRPRGIVKIPIERAIENYGNRQAEAAGK